MPNIQSIVPGQERFFERMAIVRPGEFVVCEICLVSPSILGWDLDSHPKTIADLVEHKRVAHGVGLPTAKQDKPGG